MAELILGTERMGSSTGILMSSCVRRVLYERDRSFLLMFPAAATSFRLLGICKSLQAA